MKSIAFTAALCFVLVATSAARAQAGPSSGSPKHGQENSITVGVGIGVTTSYSGARDYRVIPGGALMGTLDGHDFRLNGPQLFVDAIPNDPRRGIDFELGPVIGIDSNRTGDVSDKRVAALGELDTAVEVGGRGSIGMRGLLSGRDKLALSVTNVWDVAGAHRSYVVSPSLEYSTLADRRTFLRVALNAEFVGSRWAEYNFGISAAGSAASGLARYTPGGGFASIGTSLLATHALSEERSGWVLFGVVSYKRLQGDIAASPIVRDTGSADQFFGSLGIGYTF